MGARPLGSFVWIAAFLASWCVLGCGLELDYGPPDRVPMDSGAHVFDSGGGGSDAGDCASNCDDGLRCTADTCSSAGVCQHADTCPGDTDCVARNGGECRRACTSADDCDDGISCTDDLCDPTDHHCAHRSTCQDGTPTCLDNGACAPDHCSHDDDCDDGNMCNGAERCVSNVCHGGTHVTCPDGSGCRSEQCDPSTGTCTPVLDASACADAFDCTADVCNPDGTCGHPPNDAVCMDADLCTGSACLPDAPMHDAHGCAINSGLACPIACGHTILCDSATGLCDFSTACPTGQVCRGGTCQLPAMCTNSSECATVHGPTGCPTLCNTSSHTCQQLICPLPPAGGCGQLLVDTNSCAIGDHCQYTAVPALCDDGDALTIDTCNPDTFACTHQCPAASANDCVTYTFTMGTCVPSFDAATCTRLHGTVGAGGCARSTCVGHDPTAGGGTDGCAVRGIDALCTDGASCTTDTCQVSSTTGVGTCHSLPDDTACDDAMDCTHDACAPGSATGGLGTGCTHTPDDMICANAAGSLECATAICAQTGTAANHVGMTTLPSGCAVTYQPTNCLLRGGICTLDGQCNAVPCDAATRMRCDDGVICNGSESCDILLGHCSQLPPLTACAGSPDCMSVCTSAGCVQPATEACGIVSMGTTP